MNLNREQREALSRGDEVDLKVDDTECVLVRKDVYERLKDLYDDSEWTENETTAMALQMLDDADTVGPIE